MTDKTQKKHNHLMLIDGYGFVFRAYHSLPPLTRPDKTPVGAVYGFTNMLLKLKDTAEADYIAVIFDAGRKSFRNDMYEAYKANRPPAPDDLIPQFPLVRDVVDAMNIVPIELEGYEADDIIATYTKLAHKTGMQVTIVSSDKDLMQLVGDGVTMLDPMKSKTINVAEVEEKFGVPPERVLDALSLIGDSSDNIPGVPGIGPKTAAELIHTYGGLDEILARAGEIKQQKRRESLLEYADQARLSRDLVRLCETVPVPRVIEDLTTQEINVSKLLAFLRQQDFKSLITRVQKKYGVGELPLGVVSNVILSASEESHMPKDVSHTLNMTAGNLTSWLTGIEKIGTLVLHIITSPANEEKIIGIALAKGLGNACYVPVEHTIKTTQASLDFSGKTAASGLEFQEVMAILKPILSNQGILKIGHNIKRHLRELHGIYTKFPDAKALSEGIAFLSPIDDIMLMSYVLDAGLYNHTMPDLVKRYLDSECNLTALITTKTKEKIDPTPEELLQPACEAANQMQYIWRELKQRLVKEQMVSVYERIERPLIPVLSMMECTGVNISRQELQALSKAFTHRLVDIEKAIYALVGHEFNIGSPKQLGVVLFEEMGFKSGKKTKTGAYVTDAEVLEELALEGHALPEKILEWRMLSKLKSTYTDALQHEINPISNRVHTHFAMAATTTGRLSSHNPNLQNIPIRTEEGNKIRHAFVAEKGNKLISADYSQIELRLLAHMADIEALQDAFKHGDDIHAITASQIFGVPLKDMDPLTRRKAKAINFGIIYGISAFGLARQLGISRSDAGTYIEAYFKRYPGIQEFMEYNRKYAREHGYVKTLYGRKCYIPDINSKNPSLKSFSERAAINAPLQGTGADIIKRAMVALPEALKKAHLHAALILQVHDELLLELPADHAEKAQAVVKKTMEGVANLKVPLTAGVGMGDTWLEIH